MVDGEPNWTKNMSRFSAAMIWSTDRMTLGQAAFSVRVVAARFSAARSSGLRAPRQRLATLSTRCGRDVV